MSVTAIKDPLVELQDQLVSQLELPERRGDFDMHDEPEAEVLSPFPELQTALSWLEDNLGHRWRSADQEALRSQKQHRLLARIAIATGTSAIVLAILQLSVKLTLPGLTTIALVLEAIAIVAALIAVIVGLTAKFDRRWLGQRHLAERVRMLKFRALTQLWCMDQPVWREWVVEDLKLLAGADDFEKIDAWSTAELVEPYFPTPPKCDPDSRLVSALTTYYLFKRVEFQASYFQRRRADFKKETGGWLHLSLGVFLASVFCVIAHFALEFAANKVHHGGNEEIAEVLDKCAVWFVALAAIIPVLGVGVRAWVAAFELPRSAVLFAAKHVALKHLIKRLMEDSGNVPATLQHMAQAEHFLEHEHREWLRLLSDTEWFL
jgi:hypothetical protein